MEVLGDAAQLLRQATTSREAEPLFLSLDALYRSARAALHGPAQYCAAVLLVCYKVIVKQ